MNLNETTTIDKNKKVFIERLIAAGWTEKDALTEWANIQEDTEGEL